MRDLGISPAQAGFLSTAVFLGGGVLAVPIGWLTDRLGAKRVTTLSLAILVASTLALAAAPDYTTMAAIRLVSGFGVTTTLVAGGQYINTLWSARGRALAQGFYGGSVQFGVGAAIFALPSVAASTGWRGALAFCAVPVGLTLIVWERWARPVRAEAERGAMARVLGDATIWRLGLANAAAFGLSMVLGTWVAVYFVHEFQLSLAAAGVLGSQAVLLGMLGRPLGGALLARGLAGAGGLIRWTLAGNTLALLLLAVPGRPLAVALVAVSLVGMASSLSYAAVLAIAGRARPDAAGSALGIIAAVTTTAVVIGAPVAGALLSVSGGFTLPFAALALLPGAALWACAALPRA
jgi:NNP family nitrate/nitrite transporter-like MFS transporter